MTEAFHPLIDRRITRTRGMLQHAFMALIMRKGYDATTIQDICEEANVGRSTFYSHYKSKEDLKRKGLDHIRAALLARQKEALTGSQMDTAKPLAFSLTLFEHAREHLPLYRALLGSDGATISLGSIRQIIADLVRTEVAAGSPKAINQTDIRELKIQFIVGAFMGVLTAWLDHGATQSPSDIDALFRTMVLEGAFLAR